MDQFFIKILAHTWLSTAIARRGMYYTWCGIVNNQIYERIIHLLNQKKMSEWKNTKDKPQGTCLMPLLLIKLRKVLQTINIS